MGLFKHKKSSEHLILKTVSSVALAAVAFGLIMSLPDIKRYIKISSM